jgi:hypothetical protein
MTTNAAIPATTIQCPTSSLRIAHDPFADSSKLVIVKLAVRIYDPPYTVIAPLRRLPI